MMGYRQIAFLIVLIAITGCMHAGGGPTDTTQPVNDSDDAMVEEVSGVSPDQVVSMQNTRFQETPTVTPGTVIRFVNNDGFEHTVTIEDEDIDITVPGGENTTLRFNNEGTFSVVCTIHPGMQTNVSVTENGSMTPPEKRNPSISVKDQKVKNGEIVIPELYLDKPGYIVIHKQQDGSVGPVIGNSDLLQSGESMNESVAINTTQATDTIYGMLHYDDGDGEYNFPGNDGPVRVDGSVVVKPFSITMDKKESNDSGSMQNNGDGSSY